MTWGYATNFIEAPPAGQKLQYNAENAYIYLPFLLLLQILSSLHQHIIHITNRSCIPLPKMTALLLCDCLGNDCSTYVNVWLTESGCSAPENTPRSLNFCMCFPTHFFCFFNFVTIHLLPNIYTRLIYFSNLFDRLFMYFHALLWTHGSDLEEIGWSIFFWLCRDGEVFVYSFIYWFVFVFIE